MIKVKDIIAIASLLSLLLSFAAQHPVHREKAFDVYTNDSIRIAVELVYNTQNQPDYYFSHVRTPVCEDGLCDLLVIDLYWDLLAACIDTMNESQLESLLSLMKVNKTSLDDHTIYLLTALLAHSNPIYAEQGYQAIKAMGLKDKVVRKAIKDYEKKE